ncbi:MAG TPA: M14 family metallopeptidase [Candidatus Thermoplasmatota archaeon]|nr:M14 family metallopeptidase [Candidatus Thermoplasmatota archaeon]
MRLLPVAALALVLVLPLPTAAHGGPASHDGEMGERNGPDGWPLTSGGESTNPFPGVTADQLSAALSPVAGPPLTEVGGLTVFPYWPILKAEVERMARDHPDRVHLHKLGGSTLGLDLFILEIADFDAIEAGNGIPLAQREVVWVDGGHHSNEYSGVYFTTHLAQFLIERSDSNETAKWILENRHTWILPMVNPDGSHAFGRLNAKGVNINRNYPVIWGSIADDPVMNNPGPGPASEVETQLMLKWLNDTRPDYYASIHCCGNLWLYPYGIEGVDPIDKPMFEKVCDQAFASVRKSCGPIWSTIYPAPGSVVDSVYEYVGGVAFGFEMSGRGAVSLWGQPATSESVEVQETESWKGVLQAFRDVHLYGAHPAVTVVEQVGDQLRVTVKNDGLGNMTRGAIEASYSPNVHLTQGWPSHELPPLAVGESATVTIPKYDDGALARHPGEVPVLQVRYQKRIEATSNIGSLVVPLVFGDGPLATGAVQVLQSTDEVAHPAPVAGSLTMLCLLAVALFATRRRVP